MVAIDATYLLKSLSQLAYKDEVGLVGGCWSTFDEENCFVPLKSCDPKAICKAPIIYEFLVWDPCAVHRRTCSIASMPMALKAPRHDDAVTLIHAGNLATWQQLLLVFVYEGLIRFEQA